MILRAPDRLDPDLAPWATELQRIGNQVAEYLVQANGIPDEQELFQLALVRFRVDQVAW